MCRVSLASHRVFPLAAIADILDAKIDIIFFCRTSITFLLSGLVAGLSRVSQVQTDAFNDDWLCLSSTVPPCSSLWIVPAVPSLHKLYLELRAGR